MVVWSVRKEYTKRIPESKNHDRATVDIAEGWYEVGEHLYDRQK